jgi:7-cyano-7-deazaguanine synthase
MARAEAYSEGIWHDVVSISVDYGQRHKKETEFAQKLCDFFGVSHETVSMAYPPKSMLTDPSIKLPSSTYAELPEGISPTYVPFRNGQLLSRIAGIAQGWIMEQDKLGINAKASIWFGAHADDAARDAYPDCTPEFIGVMASAIHLGTYRRVRLITPFTHMEKKSIVEIGSKLGLPYDLTWSCYDGKEKHCGTCPTCRARKEAFQLAQLPDPTTYEDGLLVSHGSLHGTYTTPAPDYMVDEPKAFVQRGLKPDHGTDMGNDTIPF